MNCKKKQEKDRNASNLKKEIKNIGPQKKKGKDCANKKIFK